MQIKSARHDRVFCKVGTARHNLARWAWHGFPSPPSASQDLYRFWLRRGHFWGFESLIGGVSNLRGHFPLMAHTYNTGRKRSRAGGCFFVSAGCGQPRPPLLLLLLWHQIDQGQGYELLEEKGIRRRREEGCCSSWKESCELVSFPNKGDFGHFIFWG